MKKKLTLLALTFSLASCSTLPTPRPQPSNPAPSAPPYTAPASSTVAPANLTVDPILPPGWTISPLPPIIVGTASFEVTAIPAVRSPGSGANCTGVASEGEQHRLYIRSANCGAAGKAALTFTLNGQTTPEMLGDQDLILVQLTAGNVVQVTAVVKVGREQIWPK